MSNVRDYTHRPAVQAYGPPRVWGVEPTVKRAETFAWFIARLRADAWRRLEVSDCWLWSVNLDDTRSGCSASLPEAALAIEAELTRIETEIRTAREGKK